MAKPRCGVGGKENLPKTHTRVDRWWIKCLFALGLPLLAVLPGAIAAALNRLRARVSLRRDLEWRSLAVGQPFLKSRSKAGLLQILTYRRALRIRPNDLSPPLFQNHKNVGEPGVAFSSQRLHEITKSYTARLDRLVLQRFEFAANEELEAFRIIRSPLATRPIRWMSSNRLPLGEKGLVKLNECLKGRPAIWLACHFDALFVGVSALGQAGFAQCLMSSDTVDHPQVDRLVRQFFRDKYRAIATTLGPDGAVLHKEQHLRTMVKRLRLGGRLIVVGDIPAHPSHRSFPISWFGKERGVDEGVYRLALSHNALVIPFACLSRGTGAYDLVIGEVVDPAANGFTLQLRAAYAWHEQLILRYPGRWWAVDLLPLFPVLTSIEHQRV